MWSLVVLTAVFWSGLWWWGRGGGGVEEWTVAVIKPDAVTRRLQDTIVQRVECHGLTIDKHFYFVWTDRLVDRFYKEHCQKPFYGDLKASLVGKQSVALVVRGRGAIGRWRVLMAGLRAEWAVDGTRNSVHGSDGRESAEREYAVLWLI